MRRLILGGPGCGKTTRLLDVLESELAAGVPPDRVAFVSFTRAAVGEARGRAMAQFGLGKKDLPWFRTLHSLAYRLLDVGQDELMTPDDYRKVGDRIGLAFDGTTGGEQYLPAGKRDGDRVLFLSALARARGVPLRQEFNRSTQHRLEWPVVCHAAATVEKYKRDLGLLDYQDLIERCDVPLDVEVAIVDEAQDLTTAQWAMVDRVLGRVPRVYFAGDDDQAIYQWTGADVDRFLHLDAAREVLPKSHRLPEAVWRLADRQAHRIGERYEKHWAPAAAGGEVKREPRLAAVDLSQEGTWLLLARNRYLLNAVRDDLRARGIVYDGAVKTSHVDAIRGWEKLRRGKQPTEAQAEAVRRHLPRGQTVSYDHDWTEALTRIPAADRAFYIRVKRNGDRVTADPRVRLATIHQVKGAEADHVVLLTDLARRTWEAYHAEPAAEHRVWYVGLTRARRSVHVLQPTTDKHYTVPAED